MYTFIHVHVALHTVHSRSCCLVHCSALALLRCCFCSCFSASRRTCVPLRLLAPFDNAANCSSCCSWPLVALLRALAFVPIKLVPIKLVPACVHSSTEFPLCRLVLQALSPLPSFLVRHSLSPTPSDHSFPTTVLPPIPFATVRPLVSSCCTCSSAALRYSFLPLVSPKLCFPPTAGVHTLGSSVVRLCWRTVVLRVLVC